MKIFSIGALTLAMLAIASGQAWAQRGQGRGGFGAFGPGNLMLLSQKSVQEELKLSDDQVKKVDAEVEKGRDSFAELQNLDREERRAKLEERAKANDTAIAGILKEDQLKRFKQISLQQRGAAALGDAEVAQSLALTSEQKDQIKSIQDAAQQEMRAQFQGGGGGGDREEIRKKMQAAREATNEKVMGLLTAEQKDKWKAITGEHFKGEIRPNARRGGGRPGGARRPQSQRSAAITPARNVFHLAAFAPQGDGEDADRMRQAPRARANRPERTPDHGPAHHDARSHDGRPGPPSMTGRPSSEELAARRRRVNRRNGRRYYAGGPARPHTEHFVARHDRGRQGPRGEHFTGHRWFGPQRPHQPGFGSLARGWASDRHDARHHHPHHHFASFHGRHPGDGWEFGFGPRAHHREGGHPAWRASAGRPPRGADVRPSIEHREHQLAQLQRQLDSLGRQLATLRDSLGK